MAFILFVQVLKTLKILEVHSIQSLYTVTVYFLISNSVFVLIYTLHANALTKGTYTLFFFH